VAERAAYRAQTHRNVHMIWEGNALTTPGSYTYKTLEINLQGKYEDFSGFDDMDGDNVVTGTLRCRYNSTSQKFVDFLVVNEIASLTPSLLFTSACFLSSWSPVCSCRSTHRAATTPAQAHSG
jgi:hypothetical protein